MFGHAVQKFISYELLAWRPAQAPLFPVLGSQAWEFRIEELWSS